MSLTFCINGKFMDAKKAYISVQDNGILFGDGFYDSMQVQDGVIIELPLHLERLTASAERMHMTLPWSIDTIRTWLLTTVKKNPMAHMRLRLTVTRGENGFDFTTCKNPTIFIVCEALHVDPKRYEKGISCATMTLQRLLPEVKTIGLTSMIVAQNKAKELKVDEMLLVGEDGNVREGCSTNIFLIKGKNMITPKSRILKGFARKRVMALAKKHGWKMQEEDFRVRKMQSADELFITNSLWNILPVVRLNGKAIGRGKVGPQTKRIMKIFDDYLASLIRKEKAQRA